MKTILLLFAFLNGYVDELVFDQSVQSRLNLFLVECVCDVQISQMSYQFVCKDVTLFDALRTLHDLIVELDQLHNPLLLN